MLMKNEDYAYAVARIRANEVHLLSNRDIESLILADSFDSAVSILVSKNWTESNKEGFSVADAISNQYKKMWSLLSESVPYRNELEIFTVQNDFQNIKTALKCMFSNIDPDEYFVFPTSLDLELLKKCVLNRDFSKLPDNFSHPAKEAYEGLNVTSSGQIAEIILDKAALDFMTEKAKKSSSSLVREIFGFICSITDIKIAFRCAKTKKSRSFTSNALSECKDINCKTLSEKASQGENELVSYLDSSGFKTAANLISNDSSAFEKWIDDEIIEKCKKAKTEFFGFDPICAYYFAKSNEIKTVRLILYAKESGLSSDIIRERVRTLYV